MSLQQQNPFDARFSASQYPYAAFGILGDFPGDKELERELAWCRQAFEAPDKPDQTRLVALIGSLPLKGRHAVIRDIIASSPHRDAILRDLFEYCFQPDEEITESSSDVVDEEFVVIANPTAGDELPKPLNLNRFHIFQVVIALMAVSGAAGAEMSRRYLQSASTKYRAKILIQCVKCLSSEDFSDEDLWQAYYSSPDAVQNKVIEACKQSGRRKAFLRRVYEESRPDSTNLIYWLESDYVAGKLDKLMDMGFTLKRWGAHGEIYVDYIRKKMEECGKDSLKRGSVWGALRQRMELNSVKSDHVYMLLELLEKHKAYVLSKYLSQKATEYLVELSSKGDDVSVFEEVMQVRLDAEIVKKLTKYQRLQLATKYVEAKDWGSFSSLQGLVPLHKLPYKDIHAQATPNDLWAFLSGTSVDDFFRLFSSHDFVARASTCHEMAEILRSWVDLHLRSKPSDLSAEEVSKYCHGISEKEQWIMWYGSYTRFIEHGPHVTSVVENESKATVPLGSRLKVYAQYAEEILGIALQGMEIVSRYLNTAVALEPVLSLLRLPCHDSLSKSSVDAAQSFAQEGAKVLVNNVIPRLGIMMVFDRSYQDTYINRPTLSFFKETFDSIVQQWASSEQVAQCVARVLLDVFTRASENRVASMQFAVVSTPKSKRIVYIDSFLHQKTAKECLQLMKDTLRMVKVHAHDFGLFKKLWEVVRRDSFGNTCEYLSVCSSYLSDDLLVEEKGSMIEESRKIIISTYKKSPYRWKEELSTLAQKLKNLGLLESVLDEDTIPKKVQDSLLCDHAGFGNEKARQALKDETYASDGDSRASGLTSWLAEACKTGSISLIAEAMSFAASRVKNEAGAHRRTVFTWLEQNFASQIVCLSLEDEGGEVEVHEDLSSSLIMMLKNDLSRLDCVGRFVCFPRLPRNILDVVLDFDPSQLSMERRQLWADCAVRLHWTLQEATGGDERLHCFSWPIASGKELDSATWISAEHFKAAYPLSEPSTPQKVSMLLENAGQVLPVRDGFDQEKVFGPRQCVSMLERAVENCWDDSFPCRSLRLEIFPEDEEIASGLRKRLAVLFRLCGTTWQEVELLTTVFDNIFSSIETVSETHFKHASKLLELLFDIHSEPCALEVDRLARACDKVFRCAVDRDKPEHILLWFDRWWALSQRGSRNWEFTTNYRLRYFLLRYAEGCEPSACPPTVTKTDMVLRECIMVRELLAMSPSAMSIEVVRRVLFQARQDVVVRCSRDFDSLSGPFTCFNDYDSIDSLMFETLEDETLVSCHSDISRGYARFALTQATNTRLNLRSKISAITKFMSAPSTQHSDVLAALQYELEDAVRETLVNRVFSLDSPWHILGFLLSQSAIEKNDQRTTAALLGYVGQHVHVDKVVQVVEILLKEPRRRKLSFQLHKGVIRMLFDAKTMDAVRLLRNEWESELPDGVRNLVVEKCMQAVVSGETDGWAATILSQVATDNSIGPETKFHLFAPQWASITSATDGALGGIPIPRADDVETNELLDQFRQKAPAPTIVHSERIMDWFYLVFEEMENSSNGPLRFLAKLKRLSLSHLFGPEPRDDQDALQNMLEFLTAKDLEFDHKNQIGLSFLSVLFATGVSLCLNHTLSRGAMSQEVIDMCAKSDIADKWKRCVNTQLFEILDLPIRRTSRRKALLKSLGPILRTVENNCRSRGLYQALLTTPIKTQLTILKKDAVLVGKIFSP